MSHTITISLAGTATVRVGEATECNLGLGPRARVAFAYLVLERRRPVARDELAEAVWGEDLPDTWRPALRLLMSRLRSALAVAGLDGPDVLRSVGGCYELRLPGPVTVDVERAAAGIEAAARLLERDPSAAHRLAAAAASVARARFLPSDGGLWVERRQTDLGGVLREALDVASRAASACGDHTAAVAAAHESVRLEAWDEAGHLRLVGALAAAGKPAEARQAYEECRRALAKELGVAPSAEAAAEYARLVPDGAPAARLGNLRVPVSSFVGRAADLAGLERLRGVHRVVTLVGTAGVGKSRLAVELARRSAAHYADGAWVVELAGVPEQTGSVAHQVLAVLGLPETGPGGVDGDGPARALVEHLADRRALIVLDNCEHVLGPCAALVEQLAGRCPGLAVVATSRRPLGLIGEAIWTVQPLGTPGPEDDGPLPGLLHFDAVRLFVDRAMAVAPTLALDQVSGAVARICRQLDGLPLAIELTAARARSFALPEIEVRLGDRFRFLVRDGRRALQAAVDWSYDSLGPAERHVLARVALFVGGFGLDGARAVCPMPENEVADALADLVDKSLVVADHVRGTVRYRLLETMRQYGMGKLAAEGGGAEATGRDRHLAWACEVAEAAAPGLDGPDQAAWLAALEVEEENLRAALDWVDSSGNDDAGLRLAVALWRFWEIRGRLQEGRARLETIAGRAGAPSGLRARALNGAGILAHRQADLGAARRLYDASLALHREAQDRRGVAAALNGLASLAVSCGDFDRAWPLFAENAAIGRALADDRLLASSLLNLAVVDQLVATSRPSCDTPELLARARANCEQSLLLFRAIGDRHSQAMALENLGSLAALQGDVITSRRLLDESLALRRDLGDRVGMAASARFLGHLARRDGRFAAARSLHEESLSLERELGNEVLAASDLLALGEIATDQAAFDEARGFFQRSLVLYRGLGHDAGSERALAALGNLPFG